MQMQRTILWVIFGISLFLLWESWLRHTGVNVPPSSPQISQPLDSSAPPSVPGSDLPQAAGPGKLNSAAIPAADNAMPNAASAGNATNGSAGVSGPAVPGISAAPSDGVAVLTELRNDMLLLSVSSRGGMIVRSELLKHREHGEQGGRDHNVVLLSQEPATFFVQQAGLINAPAGSQFPTHHTNFTATQVDDSRVVMTAESGGLKLEREYSLQPGSYLVEIADKITNTGSVPLAPIIYRQLTRDTHTPAGDDSFYIHSFIGPVIFTDEKKFQKISFEDIADGNSEHANSANNGWAGMMQHYFSTALVPAQGVAREFYTMPSGNNKYSVGIKQALPSVAPGQVASDSVRLFIGPQQQDLLGATAPGLELMVDYGFLSILCKPLWWLLNTLHSLVGNWGWAIVLLTLIIKTIFFPLQAASYKSMARMKAVAPRLTALRERYGDDRAKLNQAMMDLYKTEKINPIGGCLPVLVQIPVFISLYWVLLASVEMRDAPWIGWITDLTSKDPYFILPLLMAISMFVQVKLNPKPPDPIQAKVMMAMPVIFSVMFFVFPAGLVLYWLVNNLYSIAQQWVITRKIMGEKA